MVLSFQNRDSANAAMSARDILQDIRIADPNTAPFLKLLYENKLIDCDKNPRDSSVDTRIRIQKFVYFAKNVFGLGFSYVHMLYKHGPYSPSLANDYYLLPDISAANSRLLAHWIRKEEFLQFARTHDDTTWLEIASTLLHVGFSYGLGGSRAAKYVASIKPNYTSDHINNVYANLTQLGYAR